MQKFIIWLKINWAKVLLGALVLGLVISMGLFVKYIVSSFMTLEDFSKRQNAGMMAMYMPMFVFAQLLFLPASFAMLWYLYRGGGMGTTKVERIDKTKTGVTWNDIIGMDEAKKDAQEVVQLIKDSTLREATGGNVIKGTLMIGPPGCGKTYLAKAIANESRLPMISSVGSEFVAMFMGQGAARMKSLFKQARELANIHGGCIIFIDEVDAFARARASEKNRGPGFSSADTSHNATINQFLTELDGLSRKGKNVIVIAATNVNEEELDEAMMRSGRFDRKIRVEKPNASEREAILKYYLKRVKHDGSVDTAKLADQTKWFSPSDINNLVREAGVIASRRKSDTISAADLEDGLDRLMLSIEKMGGDKILASKIDVKWNDVIGMESAKREAWEIVDLLRDRNQLKAVGGKIIKGVIMFGPPGCGKTYLAKAMASEAGFPFISRSGSEFVRMWVGEGARKVEELFAEARKIARAEAGCIIFIDEIDAFARPRQMDQGFGGTSSMNATINAFLTEMDGLRHAENNIIVLAASNAREGDLDSALMRPGRFDRKIYVDVPNLEERKALFKFYLAKVKSDASCDPDLLARKALYFSPAKIESMIREAGIFALRDKRDTISIKDLSNAYDRIEYGDKSNINLTEQEKVWTAYHETGHAVIGYLLHPTNDVVKATIIPRKGSLGMVSSRPLEEMHSANREKLLADIKVMVAAYVAEKMKFKSTSAGVGGGASSDFHQAMRIATHMVYSLGMGESGLVGDFQALRARSGELMVSERTKQTLDEDVQKILRSCMTEVEALLKENHELFEYFAQQLLEKGELEYDEITEIFKKFNVKPKFRPPVLKDA